MKQISILSVNVGMPKPVSDQGKTVISGIFKQQVDSPLFLSKVNFAGDAQGDLVHHGGVEKAVCVYAYEHYAYWENQFGHSLTFGAFGENLTIEGMCEDEVCIGDLFQMGEAVVQVSQPRQPCFKLGIRYGRPDLPLWFQDSGYTGFYLRVLAEGTVRKEDGLVRMKRHPAQVTIAYANHVMHHDQDNREAIARILDVEELSVNWRKTLSKRLVGERTDTRERLNGQPSSAGTDKTLGQV